MEGGISLPPEVGLALAENVLGFIFFYTHDRRLQSVTGAIGLAAVAVAIFLAASSPETRTVFSSMAWSEAVGLVTGAMLGWSAGLVRSRSD